MECAGVHCDAQRGGIQGGETDIAGTKGERAVIDDLARVSPLVVLAYGLGCVATGYYLVRWRTGADVRRQGSGGAGATNAMRVLGRPAFAAVFVADLAKGALAVGIARWFDVGALGAALVGMAVIAGHIWPAQLGFKGGKGVATAFGAALVYDGSVAVAALAIAGVLLGLGFRFVPAGLVGTMGTPILALVIGQSADVALGFALMAALVLAGHRRNIIGLLRGGERLTRRGREDLVGDARTSNVIVMNGEHS